jgi:hypothetical protein
MSARRLKALLLLLALLGGGFGLPWYDALVFHGSPMRGPSAERVLTDVGAVAEHAQLCALTLATLPGNAPPTATSCFAATSIPAVAPQPPSYSPLLTQAERTLGLSRAPPLV